MMSCRFRLPSRIFTGSIGIFFLLIAMGCATQSGKQALGEADPCSMLDSLYTSSGFESALAMTGKITFDVEQYRIRGQFTLAANPNGEMNFEFSNSTLFGNQHEDISMSIADGAVRVLDRERAKYYEGEDVDAALMEMVGLNLDVREIVSLVLGTMPPCDNLQGKTISLSRSGEIVFASRALDEDARIVFDEGKRRIRRLEWPLSFTEGKISRLQVEYTWEPSEDGSPILERLVLSVPEKGWRIKLVGIL
jgi:hypothetical protein